MDKGCSGEAGDRLQRSLLAVVKRGAACLVKAAHNDAVVIDSVAGRANGMDLARYS